MAVADDAAALARLYARAFPSSALLFEPRTVRCWLTRHGPAHWARVCASKDEVVVVDGSDGELVGMAVGRREVGRDELDRLFVDPDHWGAGLGSVLHDHILGTLAKPAFLWVLEGNDRAASFYQERRWQETGRRKAERCGAQGELRWFEMKWGGL